MKTQTVEMPDIESISTDRIATGIPDIDTILGGGFIAGSVNLLAGEPGAGKSTLLLQLSGILAEQRKVLYVSGEESLGQLKMRADRLGVVSPRIYCSETINLEQLTSVFKQTDPTFIIIDSLQELESSKFRQGPGTPTQVRYCVRSLTSFAKRTNKVLLIIGHSTKDGKIAGAQYLQHKVDMTMFLEISEDTQRKLLIRKNRFGEAPIGLELHMREAGFDAFFKKTAHAMPLRHPAQSQPSQKRRVFPKRFAGTWGTIAWVIVCCAYALLYACFFLFFVLRTIILGASAKRATRIIRAVN